MKRLLVLIAMLSLVLVACGGDDDGTVVGSSPTITSTTAMSDGSSTTMGMGDSADDQQMTVNPCADGGTGEMPGMEAMAPEDGAKAITITASEYKFGGTDALKAGGKFAITFENNGKELHELHIAKLPDGEKRSMEELFKDPNVESTTTTVGHSFACPGKTAAPAGADLTAPGRYLVVCFMPTGATPETDPKDFDSLGMPHAMNGMAVEIDIDA